MAVVPGPGFPSEKASTMSSGVCLNFLAPRRALARRRSLARHQAVRTSLKAGRRRLDLGRARVDHLLNGVSDFTRGWHCGLNHDDASPLAVVLRAFRWPLSVAIPNPANRGKCPTRTYPITSPPASTSTHPIWDRHARRDRPNLGRPTPDRSAIRPTSDRCAIRGQRVVLPIHRRALQTFVPGSIRRPLRHKPLSWLPNIFTLAGNLFVGYGSLAHILGCGKRVCFTPESRHSASPL
jgi:hypothetical protein